jgi:transcriptional regulator with XRE-family HTH domain
MMPSMGTTERRNDRGAHHSSDLQRRLATEARTLRAGSGLSQRELAALLRTSHTTVSRIELGRAPTTSIDRYARMFAILGGRLTVRVFPDGPSIRDRRHALLMQQFGGELHQSIQLLTEVRVGPAPDQRAWDGQLLKAGDRVGVECEINLVDVQALDRRVAAKQLDGGIDRVILLVAGTDRNRQIIREFDALLGVRYPLRTRGILRMLRTGELPSRSGIVVL